MSKGLPPAWLRRLQGFVQSPEAWLLLSNLLSRLLGFVVSLLVSRLAGVSSLGVYSGLLITAASPTTPVSAVLANNATMLSARHHIEVPLRVLLWAQVPAWILGLLFAALSCALMLQMSTLTSSGMLPMIMVLCATAGLIFGQLLTQTVVGLYHGSDLSIRASWVTIVATVSALATAYPVLHFWGLQGIIIQAMCVALLPGLWMCWQAWRERPECTALKSVKELRAESVQQFFNAWPNMLATVLNNGTNWLACIYFAERFHGHVGLGMVAICLQWMALMQLPVSSWGGRVMRSLSLAHQQGTASFSSEIGRQLWRCVWMSFLGGAAVLAVSPWVADLYGVDRSTLLGMLAFSASATVLAGINMVYERVFFCLGTQRPWLWFSGLAYLVQLWVTWSFIPKAIEAVSVGNLMACMTMSVCVTIYLWRNRYLRRGAAL